MAGISVQVFENYGDFTARYSPEFTETDVSLGVVYAVEFGNYVKVGCTSNPKARMSQLNAVATKYARVALGRIAISEYAFDYFGAESRAHKALSASRLDGSELFDTPFANAVMVLNDLCLASPTAEDVQREEDVAGERLNPLKLTINNLFAGESRHVFFSLSAQLESTRRQIAESEQEQDKEQLMAFIDGMATAFDMAEIVCAANPADVPSSFEVLSPSYIKTLFASINEEAVLA